MVNDLAHLLIVIVGTLGGLAALLFVMTVIDPQRVKSQPVHRKARTRRDT